MRETVVKIFSIIAIIISIYLLTISSCVLADGHSDLIKAAQNPSFKVSAEMYPAMKEAISPDSAQLFFETRARQLAKWIAQVSGNGNSKQVFHISPLDLAVVINLTITDSTIEADSQRMLDFYIGLISWDISREEKIVFLDKISNIYIKSEREK